MPHISHNLLFALCTLLVLNIVALWTVYVFQAQKLSRQDMLLRAFSTNITPPPDTVAPLLGSPIAPSQPSALAQTDQSASQNASIQLLNQRVSDLETNVKALSTQPAARSSNVITKASQVKESILYLGSGSTFNRDWTNIPSATTTLDTANYPHIKEVHFEAGLSIIGGEAHVRLVNTTTGGVFYDSELSHNSILAMWKTSPPLNLPAGSAQYSVQMKSTSGETANLIGARIRIIVQ